MRNPWQAVKKYISASMTLIILIFLSVFPQNTWTQNQLGLGIVDELAGDGYKWSIPSPIDGNRLAAVTSTTQVNGLNTGHVRVSSLPASDTEDPTTSTQNKTVYLDGSGNASIVPADVDDGSSDNVGITSYSLDINTFDCDDLAAPVTVTLTVEDAAGNDDSETAQVTVLDTIAPIRTLNNYTLQLDATGNAILLGTDVTSGVSDNAGGTPTITLGQTAFDCTDIGIQTIAVTVSDGTNSRGDSVQVTVLDTVAPTYNTTAATKVLSTLTGQVTLLEGDVINSIVDACDGSPAVNISKTDFNCSDIGANTVMVTVTDTYGNSRSQAVSVTIEHHPVVNANFEIVRDTACVVTVYNTSTDYNHLIWAWGDGSFTHTREVDTVQHTYTDIDDFIITLTAFDTCDYTSTHVDTVRIWPYLHNNTTDTSCTDEPYSVIDADCISIAL